MQANPGTALAAFGRKLLLAINHYEVPNHYPIEYFAARSPVLALTPIRFVWIGPLGMLGIVLLLVRRQRGAPWLAVSTILLMAVLALFFVTDRYRLLTWPILAIGVGASVEEIGIAAQRRDFARLLRLGAATGLLVALVALPGHPDFGRAQFHFILSTVLAEQGDQAGSRRELETAAHLGEIPEAAHNLANAYYREGRYAEAAAEYRRALALDPDAAGTLLGLGLAELGLGNREAAAVALSAALERSPQDERVARALALAQGAGDSLEIARVRRHSEARPVFTRALTDARAGRRDSARAGFERVLELDPEDAAAHLNLGLLAEMDGDWDAAESHLESAAEHGATDHLELLLARGRVAARQGNMEEARRFFSRALEVSPGDPRARSALAAMGAGDGNP
jgi:tetratricopeptide (TPR) repeat protein